MFYVKGAPVMADEMEVLYKLRDDCLLAGMNLFHRFRMSGSNDIMTTCPFHKGGQERKPSFGISKVDGTCHCFRGDTRVITKFGTFEISELCDKSVEILNGNGEWELVTFRSYGVQSLMKLTLRCNTKKKEIFATPEHEWVMQDFVRKKRTNQLKPGHRLKKVIPSRVSANIVDPMGVVHGFCYGDGTQTAISTSGNRTYECCFYTPDDLELKKFFIQCGFTKFTERFADNGKSYPAVYFSSVKNMKEVPDITESPEYLLGFIAGYFAADGNCSFSNITICSSKYEDLKKVRDICTRLGIASSKIGDSFISKGQRGCIYVKSDRWYHTLHLSRNCLPDSFFLTDKGRGCPMTKYDKIGWVVESVEPTDIVEEVYCCQTSTHSFALEDFILTGNCFACGWAGGLTEMISAVFGYNDNGAYGEKWLSRNFLSLSVEMRKPLTLQMSRGVSRRQQRVPGFTEQELDSYRYIHPYMYERGLTDEIIEEFDIGYDARSSAITFPCYYADGFPAFIARRSVKTKYFNYPEDVEKPVYGADRFYRQQYDFAVICESVFNALTCWKHGLPAVALLGTGAKEQYDILKNMPVRKFILGLDPDEAGRKGASKIRQYLGNSKIITEFDIPEGYDINDLDEKVLELKEFF